MSLAGILSIVADDPRLRRAFEGTAQNGVDLVAPPALRPVLTAAIASQLGQFVLAVTATAREAEDLTASLGSFLPEGSVAFFPGWETLPHERLSPRSDTVGQRIAVLRRLSPPGRRRQRSRTALGRRRAGQVPAAADRRRSRGPGAGPVAGRRHL